MLKQQFNHSRRSDSFNSITLGLLSPEKILERSFGEVLKPETINYRSYKPEKMVYFVKKYLDLLRIGNVIVVNTKVLDTEVLYVIDAV